MAEKLQFPLIIQGKPSTNRLSWRYRGMNNSRILDKEGNANVFFSERHGKHYRYAKDLGNTLINTRWRWILLSLCAANGIAWVLFALMWMTVALVNGDYNKGDAEGSCIVGTRHFAGYLLFSIETLTTIGFGTRYPTADCHESWVVLMLQALTLIAIEGILVTTIYVKMTRVSHKYSARLFSKKAILCLRDGRMCLIFRLYDEQGRFWAHTKIYSFMVLKKFTKEGDTLPNYLEKLKLEVCGLMMGPVDVVHIIDQDSPLWEYSAHDIIIRRFEIILVIQGDSTITGQPSESSKSYSNNEILWGSRFRACMEFDRTKGHYIVHEDRFNSTFMCDAPLCSASKYEQVKREYEEELKRRQSL